MNHPFFLYFLLALTCCLQGSCSRSQSTGQDPSQGSCDQDQPASSVRPDPSLPERSLELPVKHRGKRPTSTLIPGTTVWTVLSYPKQPDKYRIAQGRLVEANENGVTIENTGMNFSGIPWSLVHPVSNNHPEMGMTVLVTGRIGVYLGKVEQNKKDSLEVRRIWRDGSRMETTTSESVIVQNQTREFGQVVFYNKKGYWNQGLAIHEEERHLFIIEGLGGAVVRVGTSETNTWNPGFSPKKNQDVESCRGGASLLVPARITQIHERGLFFDVELEGDTVRYRVPFWEILPAGSIL